MANCEDFPYSLCNKNNIEFVWGKKHDFPFRHSAILVKFDDEEEIVIDFSALNLNEPPASRSVTYVKATTHLALPDHFKPIEGNIRIYSFSQTMNFEILGSILKFNIDDKIKKERASDLIMDLLHIKMGPYHAKTNNCRHFIKRAFEILEKEPECTNTNRENFKNEIKALENEDNNFVHTATSVAAVGFGVVLAAGAASLMSNHTCCDNPEPIGDDVGETDHEKDG